VRYNLAQPDYQALRSESDSRQARQPRALAWRVTCPHERRQWLCPPCLEAPVAQGTVLPPPHEEDLGLKQRAEG
jgi:hypothetical protein